jgi:uncharacterized protein YhfF
MSYEEYWNKFKLLAGLDESVRYSDVYYFGLDEKLANELLDLVLKGKKQATTSSIESFIKGGIPLPKVGNYYILTSYDGTPKCIVKNVRVIMSTFKELTFDIVKLEGEDDNLESWRQGHQKFFTEEGKHIGYTFSPDMKVVFEEFEVVYQ